MRREEIFSPFPPAAANAANGTFETWVARAPFVSPLTTPEGWSAFAALLAQENDSDPYALSPTYYAATGRDGLWLYERDGTVIPFCRHPVHTERILVFPPRGNRTLAAITSFLSNAVAPADGFFLARFKPEEIGQLQMSFAFLQPVTFAPVAETKMDWRFGVRLYDCATLALRNDATSVAELARPFVPADKENVAALIAPEAPLAARHVAVLAQICADRLSLRGAILHEGQRVRAALVWDKVKGAKTGEKTTTAAIHLALGDEAALRQLIALQAAQWRDEDGATEKTEHVAFGGEMARRIDEGGFLPPADAALDLCSVRAVLCDDLGWPTHV